MIRKFLNDLALADEREADAFRQRMAENGERFIQWQRELLLENPNDLPQFWRWKRD